MRLVAHALMVMVVWAVGCSSGSSSPGPGQDTTAHDQVGLDSVGETSPPDTDPVDQTPSDQIGESALQCDSGQRTCLDDTTVLACQNGFWVTVQVCAVNTVCLAGNCVAEETCQPGTVKNCYSLSALNVCHESGRGHVPYPCPEGEKCLDGQCSVLTCNPGARLCDSPTSYQVCSEDGSSWGASTGCDEGETCIGGKCQSGCAGDPKWGNSNVGCEFWSLDLGQWHVRPGESQMEPSASTIPHAVVVGNPGTLAVKVTFETGDGTPVVVPDPTIPPGQSRAFTMPVMSLQDTSLTRKSIRMRSNHPVTAAQFNPPSNQDFVHTSDASLLYPVNILGKEHFVVTLPSSIGPDLPMLGKSPSVWGYGTVVATSEGTTEVTVGPLTAPTEPGEELPAYGVGQIFTVELQQWEVLHLNALATSMFGNQHDMTGTRIFTSQPAAVFSGHDCMTVGDSNCDHLETQLLPVENWGDHYIAGRMQTKSPNEYRVVSGDNGVVLSTKPSVAGLDGKTLDKGKWVHVVVDSSFEISASGPIQVIQFIAGNSEGGLDLVDPSLTTLIPTKRFRYDYPILVPSHYSKNFVSVVKPAGTTVQINGNPVSAGFTAIPGTTWEAGNVSVSEGVNHITGDAAFGLISYGYATKVSYAYPGGLDGKPL